MFKKNQKGFTIAELIISMVIMSLLVAVSIPIIKSKIDKVDDAGYYLAYQVANDISANVVQKYNWDDYEISLNNNSNKIVQSSTSLTTMIENEQEEVALQKFTFDKFKQSFKTELYTMAMSVKEKLGITNSILSPLNYVRANAENGCPPGEEMVVYGVCTIYDLNGNAINSFYRIREPDCYPGYFGYVSNYGHSFVGEAAACGHMDGKSCTDKYYECPGNKVFNPATCVCADLCDIGFIKCGKFCVGIRDGYTCCGGNYKSTSCGTNETWDSSACSCQCKPGYIKCGDKCVKEQSGYTCCKNNYVSNSCGTNETWDGSSCSCQCNLSCGTNEEPNSSCTACQCKPGYIKCGDKCVKEQSGYTCCKNNYVSNSCGTNETWDGSSCSCQCNLSCGTNEEPNSSCTACQCKPGYIKCGDKCVKEQSGYTCCKNNYVSNSCGTNETWDGSACSCVAKEECGPNQERVNGVCKCKSGYELINNVCVPVCQSPFTRLSDGSCGCPSTQEYVSSANACLPKCVAPETRQSNNQCGCGAGKIVCGGACVSNSCTSPQTFNTSSCSCKCPNSCDSTEVQKGDCSCSCGDGYEKINGTCVIGCSSGKTRCEDGTCKSCCDIKSCDGENEKFNTSICGCDCKSGFERHDGKCVQCEMLEVGICTLTNNDKSLFTYGQNYPQDGIYTLAGCKDKAKQKSAEDGVNSYTASFYGTGTEKYCGDQPIIPSPNTPVSTGPFCAAVTARYNIIEHHANCPVNESDVQAAIVSGHFDSTTPNIVMNNGTKIYINSDTPQEISELDGDGVALKDKTGFKIYIDINGTRGKGLLYEDVFPFYITLSGKTIPAYPMSTADYPEELLETLKTQHAGGDSNNYLSLNVIYDDFSDGHKTKLIMKSTNFKAAACATGYVNINSEYCKSGSGTKLYTVCNTNNSNNVEHNCRFLVQKPFRFFR